MLSLSGLAPVRGSGEGEEGREEGEGGASGKWQCGRLGGNEDAETSKDSPQRTVRRLS